jgi:hypothetical protein
VEASSTASTAATGAAPGVEASSTASTSDVRSHESDFFLILFRSPLTMATQKLGERR